MGNLPRMILLASAAIGVPAMAQLLPAEQPKIFWRANDLVVIKDGFCTVQLRSNGKSRSFKLPADFRDVHATEDGFWANRMTGQDGSRDNQIHFSPDGIHWHLQAVWPVRGTAPNCRIFALKNCFFAVATGQPFTQGKSSSHFGVLRQTKGSHLELDSLLQMGIGKSVPDWIFVPPVIQTAEGWAVVNIRTGHVWLAKEGEPGQVQLRMAKLFGSVKDESIQKLGSIDPPILGCQPAPDGSLLVASRSEEAVLKAPDFRRQLRKGKPEPPLGDALNSVDLSRQGPNPEVQAKLQEITKHLENRITSVESPILEAFPDLMWWELSPATGKFTKVSTPAGAPGKLLTPELFRGFCFRFDFKGNLVVNS
jgi:hypothetical protein